MRVTVESLRRDTWGGVLGDVCCRIPGWPGYPWTNYLDSDDVTSAHEGTHAINAGIRNRTWEAAFGISLATFRPIGESGRMVPVSALFQGGAIYGCYMLDGEGIRLPPLNGVTLEQVAASIPREDRGPRYKLYMLQQATYWNDSPLYPLDELCAYTNGMLAGRDLGREDRAEQSRERGEEMLRYTRKAQYIAEARNYQASDELAELLDRCEQLLR